MNAVIRRTCGLALCLVFPLLGAAKAPRADSPNIVFILADDMAWYGTSVPMQKGFAASAGRYRRTPHLARLAEEGMTFSRAYAAAGVCAPSRCSIQTGMTAARTRFSGNGNFGATSREVTYDGRRNKGRLMLEPSPLGSLAPDQPIIPERLKPLGYRSAHVGKWHVYGGGPGKRGYEVHDGETSNAEGKAKDPADPKNIFSMTRKAIGFMKKQSDSKTPFYLQVSHYAEHNAVHHRADTLKACETDPKIAGIENRALKRSVAARTAMVEDMDVGIGMLLKAIDELGLAGNTYVIFTSDNGHHRETGEEKILRGNKWWLWECGIRVPMIVRGPGIKAGSRNRTNVVGYDFLPTFFDLAGGDPKKLGGIDGVSLKPLLLGGPVPAEFEDRPLFFHYPHHRNTAVHSAVIRGDYKLMRFYEQPDKLYLYNLRKDIGERKNLASSKTETAYALQQEMKGHFDRVKACLPKPNPDADPDYVPYDPDAPEVPREKKKREKR